MDAPQHHDRSDGELLGRFIADRCESAFAELVNRHGPMVFAVCRSVLGQSHDAEDAAQAVFLTLAQKAGSLRGHRALAGWLHRVAWYTARRGREARAIRRQHEQEYLHMQQTAQPLHEDEVPAEVLHAALAELPEKYRVPLLLHYLEGQSEAQTAALLGLRPSAASMRLSRGREKLRRRLSRIGIGRPADRIAGALGAAGAAVGGVMPDRFAASAARAAVSIATGHAVTAAASASVAALSKGALSMLIRTKLKMAGIVAASALLVSGAGAATILIVRNSQDKNVPVPAAQAPTTQESRQEIADAAKKLQAIRTQIENAGHDHGVQGHAALVDAGFAYLAQHLHDEEEAKFHPLTGFTDYTLSPGDGATMMLLLERSDAHNGLNLTIDLSTGAVTDARYWGKQN